MKTTQSKSSFSGRSSLLLFFLRGSKRFFGISILCAGLVAVLDLINPRIVAFTVDSIIGNLEADLPGPLARLFESAGGTEYFRTHLYRIAALVVAVALVRALFRYGFLFFNARGEEGVVQRARNLLYDHIIHLPLVWHGENQTGDIIQRCTSDVDTIRNFLAEQLTTLVRVVILIVLALVFMFRIHVGLTFVAVALVPVIIAYSFYFHRKIGDSFEKVDAMEGRLSAMAQENLTGVRVVRAFGRESYERERFEAANETYMNTWVRLMRLLSFFWASGDLVGGLQVLLIVAFGASLCVRGHLTAGEYIEFISYNAMLTWPVRMLGRVIADMSKAGISIDRLLYILNSERETDEPGAHEAPMDGDIEFDHICFAYEAQGRRNGGKEPDAKVCEAAGESVLSDVSFTVKAGTTVGILGGTGSGKSTLVHLLDRLYELGEGQGAIRIGGTDIRQINREYLRRNIGIVLQEPYLFSGTLAENIAITSPESAEAAQADPSRSAAGRAKRSRDTQEAEGTLSEPLMRKVRAAARVAALDETAMKFAKGYDTYVGERGVTLSGGQKQRTAIAQMLLRKPPIQVFDDSLSAVDAETDGKIRRALAEESKGTTTILIAHRVSTLMRADDILVLDHGRIVEEGTHEELIARNGIYKRIYDLQQPEHETA